MNERGSTKPDIKTHGLEEAQILIMQTKYYGVENMSKKAKKFDLKLKTRKVGGVNVYDILNQYGKPATRPFLNKNAAEKYIRDTKKKRNYNGRKKTK